MSVCDRDGTDPSSALAEWRQRLDNPEMAFDEELAHRVRAKVATTVGVTELKMFGGWGVTVHGNMAVGVMEGDLIVRVGPAAYEDALTRAGARPFDFTGRSMTGWVYVDGASVSNARTLHRWVDAGVTFAESLPPKSAATRPRPRRKTSK